MTRKAYGIVNALKSHIDTNTGKPKYVCNVTTLSHYQKEDRGQYFTFIEDDHEGCNLDAFKEDFAVEKSINAPSSCDALFLWKDSADNADEKTRLRSDYSEESLLFVEFKHAPIFETRNGKIDFLHAGQNGGIDSGCYEASIQKKLEDSCIILMQMLEKDKEHRLQFKDCKRMNVAFIVYNSSEERKRERRVTQRIEQVNQGMRGVQLNQKKVFRGLENYLYRKVRLMPESVFKELLKTGMIYI